MFEGLKRWLTPAPCKTLEINGEKIEMERVVDVHAGDIVILRCDGMMNTTQIETIKKYLKDYEPAGVRFMVLDHNLSVETVLRFEPDYDDEEPPPEKANHL